MKSKVRFRINLIKEEEPVKPSLITKIQTTSTGLKARLIHNFQMYWENIRMYQLHFHDKHKKVT